ncbi:hypothetical protein SAMN02787148_102237 [Burkholderia vietnamiensis]|nr:hypothetical protein EC918_103108 [Burkholderia vietnamiensis]SCZ21265.1 hypothetical protein SAMN02787148_102237 [Burkholderia vietnamiensis]SFX12495.1 hypothetical protein SAMN02787160_102107 [Burkholderia vietnamiensis]
MVGVSWGTLRNGQAQINCFFKFAQEIVKLSACVEKYRAIAIAIAIVGSETVQQALGLVHLATLHETLYIEHRITVGH